MKILQLAKYYPPKPGGIESVVRDLSRAFSDAGHDNWVLAHSDEICPPDSGGALGAEGKVIRVASWGEVLYAPFAPAYLFFLHRILKQFKPDVVLAHMPNVSAFWPLFLKLNCPLLVLWHSDVIFPSSKRLHNFAYRGYASFERQLLKKASKIIVTSEPYMNASMPLRNFQAKCRTVPLGVDTRRVPHLTADEIDKVRSKFLGTGDCRYIYAAGRFSHYKGFDVLVMAAELIRRRHEDVRVVIAGEGETRSHVLSMIRNMDLEEAVVAPGRVSDHEFWALMAGCECFCLPSIDRTEAFGIVLLEAMVLGKRCVTSDIPGSGTGWVNQWNPEGISVPPGNVDVLAEKLSSVLDEEHRPAILTPIPAMFSMKRVASCLAAIGSDCASEFSVK